jgi:hypothetical protein
MGTIQGLHLLTNGAEEMNYEVQTYDTTDNTVYYETVEDVMSGEDARDIIAEKYPNRKVLAVIGRKTLEELAQGLPKVPVDAL